MTVLVTGGAGYIGSHIVKSLVDRGQQVAILDDLREGHVAALPPEAVLIRGSFDDAELLRSLHADTGFEAVVHMAAQCLVGESVERPDLYYANNLTASLRLADTLVELGVKRLVFSSSAAVYGDPTEVPIPEDHPCRPTNPYGETKLAFERALAWYQGAFGLRSISLRYFNAAGADSGGSIGEDHDPETHLIPLLLRVALGGAEQLIIHGGDFPTPDGTCVRDYVHVDDLAAAHLLALEALATGEDGDTFNLGSQSGHSVREVLEAGRKVTGHPLPARVGPRRPGDPPSLVASSRRIRERLGWSPRHTDLEEILRTAWEWHRAHPQGYASPAHRC